MKFEISLTSDSQYRIFGFAFDFELFGFIKSLFDKKKQEAMAELPDPIHPHEISFGGGA